jgi:lipopolysaccharide heptosyltransferase II
MTPIRPGEVHRILIRANNWIGDVVMISPAVRAIREHFRDARIAMLAKRWVLDALAGQPYYDDLIEYDDDGAHRGLTGRLRLAGRLRAGRFDLAILFQKAFDAAFLAAAGGARRRVGYATDGRRWLLTHPLPPPPPDTHHAEAFLAIARAVGCPVRDPRPVFHVDPRARVAAESILAGAGLGAGAPLVALHPGASKPPRAWHAGRFAELGSRLARRTGARILVLGGPGEVSLLRGIAAAMPEGTALIADPRLPLQVAAGLLLGCRLFVGNDSGPMHLAAALGVPTLGLFGPGDPARTLPRDATGGARALGRSYPCSPCRQEFFHECPPAPSGKPFCLEEIGVDEVERAALDLMTRGSR